MDLLKGVKVLDLTRVLSGPYCTMILGDLGAEIIKIERPENGDDSRHFGPFYKGESAYFKSINRNKKSITVDLKTDNGKEIIKNLIKKTDVIVENFRPGAMDRLGLSCDEVSKINPHIIYGSVSGFGHSGPYSEKPAYDAVVQAMGGIMSITGQKDGEPTRVGSSIGDITAGLYCAIGILSALYNREKTGEGNRVDISMLDCQLSLLENAVARYSLTGQSPEPIGNRHSSIVPFETLKTKDSTIMIAVGNDRLWEKFTSLINNEKLKKEKFETNDLRNKNYEEVKNILVPIFKEKTTDEWVGILDKKDIPNSPINKIEDVVKNQQILARNMINKEKLDDEKELYVVNSPLKFGKGKDFEYSKAPELGEDTDEVMLKEIGLTKEEIKELKEKNII